jgi:hypothetical protein
MDSIRGLFSGTSAILDAFDSAEVRKIKAVAEKIQASLSVLLTHHIQTLTKDVFVSNVSSISQTIVSLVQLCQKRSIELLKEELELELKSKADTLSKLGTPFISVCKLFLVDGSSPAFYDMMTSITSQMISICRRITEIVEMSPDEEFKLVLLGLLILGYA